MNPNEKAARRRDNAIAAGAVLAGGGVAAGGYGAIRGAKAIKSGVEDVKRTTESLRKNADQVTSTVQKTANDVGGQVAKTGAAVRQTSRRAGRAATAPSRAVAKGARAGGKLVSKLKKFFKMQAYRAELNEFRASEIEKGTMNVNGTIVSVEALEKRLAGKTPVEVPWKSVKGMARQKGLTKERLKNVAPHLDKPGIILEDGTLVDGRHRSRMRKASGMTHGIYRKASKADIKASAVQPTQLSAKIRATYFAKIPIDPMFQGFLGKASLRVSDRKTLKQIKDQGARIINKTDGKGQRVAKRMAVGHEAHGYARVKLDNMKLKTTGKTTPDLPFVGKKKDLSRRGKVHNFMFTEDPSVQEEKKKRKKQIRGIGRMLRLQFESKPNREERIAGHIADGVGLTKAAASGAVTGSMVGGPVGAAVGGVAGLAGQAGMQRVAKKKDEQRKPIQAAAARAAIPAALITGGAILKDTEKGKRMMKKTKAVGRLVRRRLKNLEAQLDEVIEFKTGDSLIKGAKKAAKAGTEAAGKSLKWRQKVARKVAGIRDGESVVGISKTGQRTIRAAGVAGGVAPLAVMAHKAKKSEGKAKDEHNEHLSKAMLRKNIIRTKSQRKEDRDADKKFLKGSYNRTGAIVGSAGGAIAGGSVGGFNGAYIGSQAGGIAGAHLGGLIDRKPKKKKELSLVARLTELEANLDRLTELSKSKQWVVKEGEHSGSYEKTQKVLDGRVKPTIRNPNYDPKAFPGSAHSQPFKDDDTPIGINQQAWRASERKAKTAVKWGGRAKNAASDLKDVVTGKPRKKDQAGRAKKREWEKSYAKNAIATGIATGGIMAGNAYLRKNPEKRDAIYGAVERGTAGIIKKGKKVMAAAFSEGPLRRGMIHEFVSVRDDSGRQVFRVEDARGNSARIHAGDKPKRDRRPKRWNEKVENERKLWGAGVVAAGGAGLVAGAKGKEIAKATKESKLYQGVKKSKVGQQVAQGVERMVSPKRRLIREIAKQGARAVN